MQEVPIEGNQSPSLRIHSPRLFAKAATDLLVDHDSRSMVTPIALYKVHCAYYWVCRLCTSTRCLVCVPMQTMAWQCNMTSFLRLATWLHMHVEPVCVLGLACAHHSTPSMCGLDAASGHRVWYTCWIA